MSKLTSMLNERFLKKEKPKTGLLAAQTTDGSLSSFSGIFGSAKLNKKESEKLTELLQKFAEEGTDIAEDHRQLSAITSEVKAIQSQAVMLHGERIKKAQEILKKYRDGAFSSWLLSTYGNRQTPYNFLQYYEFYSKMPQPMRSQIEAMPRQAIYTLASREGALEKKEEIIREFKGQTKEELLNEIREAFPLDEQDRRKENLGYMAIMTLKKIKSTLQRAKLSKEQKLEIQELLASLKKSLDA